MLSKKIIIFWMCGIQTLSPVFSYYDAASRYSYENNQNLAKNTVPRTQFVPLIQSSDRVKRDTVTDKTQSEPKPTVPTTTRASVADKIPNYDNLQNNNSPVGVTEAGEYPGQLTDDFLKKQVFLNKTSAEKDVKTHNEYNFDNDTLHKYYSHIIEQEKDYFVDLDYHNSSGPHAGKVQEHNMLSSSYRRAATINLSFKFPFYGHPVENITIATGGFLYTGDYVHSWLAATQYIAPLMANFDTSSTHNAKIRYLDDGEKLIVEWKDVYLQDKSVKTRDGPFTFQVILFQNGNITFAYQTIPIDINIITDEDHPVKVGLSDAYIIDRTVYFARRKTIYEYHRLSMKDRPIQNKTAILFTSLPTCNTNPDCNSCLLNYDYEYEYYDDQLRAPAHKLECRWCEALGRCSDGTDRNRQEWLKNKCDSYNVSVIQYCSKPTQSNQYGVGRDSSQSKLRDIPDYHDYQDNHPRGSKMSAGSIVVSVMITVLVITFCGWLGYAYFNPNTASGRFLIKYRPGAWRWRQHGGRYTAASIHM